MQNKQHERGTIPALKINKISKRVETLSDFHLFENGQRVYSPNNKPSANDVGAVPSTGGEITGRVKHEYPSSVKLPVGTTEQRGDGEEGSIRFNKDERSFEGFNGDKWAPIGSNTVEYITHSVSVVCEKNKGHLFDTNVSGLVATLPTDVKANDFVVIGDGGNNANIIHFTVSGFNGDDLIIDRKGCVLVFTFVGDKWVITDGVGEMAADTEMLNGHIKFIKHVSDFTAEKNLGHLVDTEHAVNATLPANAEDDDFTVIGDYSGLAETNPIKVHGFNGDVLILDKPNVMVRFTWLAGKWVITDGIGESQLADLRDYMAIDGAEHKEIKKEISISKNWHDIFHAKGDSGFQRTLHFDKETSTLTDTQHFENYVILDKNGYKVGGRGGQATSVGYGIDFGLDPNKDFEARISMNGVSNPLQVTKATFINPNEMRNMHMPSVISRRFEGAVGGSEGVWLCHYDDGYFEMGGLVWADNRAEGVYVQFPYYFSQLWNVHITPYFDGSGRALSAEANNGINSWSNEGFYISSGQGKSPCRFVWTARGTRNF